MVFQNSKLTIQNKCNSLVVNQKKYVSDIPAVYIAHQKYKVDYGDSVVMKCIITATPDINEIYWEKHIHSIKTTLYAGHTGTYGKTISGPSLTIYNVTLEDNAMYRCCAKNFVGTGLSTITELIVKGGMYQISNIVCLVLVYKYNLRTVMVFINYFWCIFNISHLNVYL